MKHAGISKQVRPHAQRYPDKLSRRMIRANGLRIVFKGMKKGKPTYKTVYSHKGEWSRKLKRRKGYYNA